MPEIPLGRPEGQTLEFKSAAAVDAPSTIGRSVVGFLNSGDGGEIWVGVAEENEHAVAIEAVPEPSTAKRRIWDHLLDTIEPRVTEQEIKIEIVEHESGRAVIRIVIRAVAKRRPFAYMRGAARSFYRRIGARLDVIPRDTLFDNVESDSKQALDRLRQAKEKAGDGLLVALQPVAAADLDLDSDDSYLELLMEPAATGNRKSGWNFANPYQTPKMEGSSLVQDTPGHKRVEVRVDGGVVLWVPKSSLRWRDESIYPFALIEYTTSVLRLAKHVYERGQVDGGDVLGELAVLGARGLSLRGGSPRASFFGFHDARSSSAEEIVMQPRHFAVSEIRGEPDRCAARLWREVYRAFGFRHDAWPPEYDTERGILEIPN